MAKKKRVKRNWTHHIYFNKPLSNLPGVDNSKVIRVDPIMIRDDGYVLPIEPMTKRRWYFLWYISYIIPIRRFGKKHNPFETQGFEAKP